MAEGIRIRLLNAVFFGGADSVQMDGKPSAFRPFGQKKDSHGNRCTLYF